MYQVTSRFIETPARKVVRIQQDCTKGSDTPLLDFLNCFCCPASGPAEQDVTGADVRLEATVWQDESDRIGGQKERLERFFVDRGALSVDIRITRIPRETIRAESVLKAETLRAKIEERAAIVGEITDPEVLVMADLLEGSKAEELLKQVMGGAA